MEGEWWTCCITFLKVVCHEETVHKQWREGLIVRRGKVFCKVINNRLVQYLDCA